MIDTHRDRPGAEMRSARPGARRQGSPGPARRWARVALVYLAVSFLSVGLWATLAPQSFYDGFPGGGRTWIAGDGPFNAHLVSDTGVGFLAVGVVLVLAAVWPERRLVQAASVATLVHAAPHLFFHLRHPSEALTSLDTGLSNGGLAVNVVVALIVLVAASRGGSTSGVRGPGRAG